MQLISFIKTNKSIAKMYLQWVLERMKVGGGIAAPKSRGIFKLIIIPSDPWTLIGAKGDEAMMQSVVSQLRNLSPNLSVAVITATRAASNAARKMGFEPLEVWDQGLSPVIAAIRIYSPDSMAIVGADCMDGYYNPSTTLRLLAIADISARLGTRVTLLGFSFNASPNPALKPAFNKLSPRVAINVRDQISLDRFRQFTSASAHLVTDSAFMLPAAASVDNLAQHLEWIARQRRKDCVVIGFNVHPMLLKERDRKSINTIVEVCTDALDRFVSENNVSICLISHDYRGDDGDDVCLKIIYDKLSSRFSDKFFYTTRQLSSAEIKSLTSYVDGVVTGRMHLAIASLGVGTPVAALTYQDKFQGLFRHFDFPESLLLSPKELVEEGKLLDLLTSFLRNLTDLRQKTRLSLEKVKTLSKLNVSELLE